MANPEKLKKLQATAKRRKLPFYAISAVTGLGVDALKYAMADAVRKAREQERSQPADETDMSQSLSKLTSGF